jgi:UDP-glucuronate 4-epimerase
MKILVTGNAGFIGFHTVLRLLRRGESVVGADVVNDYYDPSLKEARLRILETQNRDYNFVRANLADRAAVDSIFAAHRFDRVIHLAAQAGVRYSITNPMTYVESNIIAFTNVLEACRHARVPHLTYASTSSVYGGNESTPFSEAQAAVHPLQFYAATKRANELMAHSYSHLFGLPTTGLRFFTVYGPWGRPDMALYLFTRKILGGEPIEVFNHGNHTRDFTYVDDIVEGVVRTSDDIAQPSAAWAARDPDPGTSKAPYRVLNIGNSNPVRLSEYIACLEEALGRTANKVLLPLQRGDVPDTSADVSRLEQAVGYWPRTSVQEGVNRFVAWYREYHGV